MEMERMGVAAVERKAGERRGGAESRRCVIFFLINCGDRRVVSRKRYNRLPDIGVHQQGCPRADGHFILAFPIMIR
jgi:hypothetical protein